MGSISVWVSPPPGTWGGLLSQGGFLKHHESGILSQPYYPLLLSWGMAGSASTPQKVAIGAKTPTVWLSPRSLSFGFEAQRSGVACKKECSCKVRVSESTGCHGSPPRWRNGSQVEKGGAGARSLQLKRRLTKGKVFSKCRRGWNHLRGLVCTSSERSGSLYEEGDEALESSKADGGRILREVLYRQGRIKMDYTPDGDFYSFPRFVTHVDATFLRTLTNLYRERLSPGAEILDLMSSWVSHLPPDVEYARVIGHGMNALELSKNKQLTEFFVKDLNQDPKLERADRSLDAVICTVSVQYLQQPEKIFAEIYRVLRPGGVCIISFSNRMFYQKAVATWRDGTMYSRTQLVKQYFQCVRGFTEPEVIREVAVPEATPIGDAKKKPYLTKAKGVLENLASTFRGKTRDPFVAVVAYRNFRPVYDKN